MVDMKNRKNATSGQFDMDGLASELNEVFIEKIPFNKWIGLRIDSLSFDQVALAFDMKETLIGNYIRRALHGGVISTVIDITGILAAFMSNLKKMPDESNDNLAKMAGRLGTIDLRIDYLRPGIGNRFTSSGYILRAGKKVAVARIEMENERKDLIAVGTGSYLIG